MAVDANNMLHLYASMLHERRIIITSSKLSTVSNSSTPFSSLLHSHIQVSFLYFTLIYSAELHSLMFMILSISKYHSHYQYQLCVTLIIIHFHTALLLIVSLALCYQLLQF